MEKIKDNKKTIAHLYFYTDIVVADIPKEKFISNLVKDLQVFSVGYAGFRKKEYLRKHLEWLVFGTAEGIKQTFKVNKKRAANIIERAIKKCHQIIASEPTRIFVFPTFNPFVIKKMSGVTGYCPWQKTIHLYINPVSCWQKALESSVYHEFNHSVVAKYHQRKTLLDNIIIEGLAENFNESMLKTTNLWAKSVPLSGCKTIFSRIKRLLKSRDYNLYYELFFAGKKYPLWAGYSIGYQIVKSFIKKNKNLTWKEIIKIRPEIILKKSDF